jgi:hypothetical protein
MFLFQAVSFLERQQESVALYITAFVLIVKLGDLSVFLFASFAWKTTVVTSLKNIKMCTVSQRSGTDHGS